MSKKKDSPFAKLEALRAKLPEKSLKGAPAAKAANTNTSAGVARSEVSEASSFAELMGRPSKARSAEAESVHHALDDLVHENLRFALPSDLGIIEGRRVGADAHLAQLRRGQYPVDDRLDLHGLTRVEADDRLSDFLKTAASKRERCVLIVHGKGARTGAPSAQVSLQVSMSNALRSDAGHGVLRSEMRHLLTEGKAARWVQAFTEAPQAHGGEGATLVLLVPR
jgi:DNA-nicking Smr family endonuclease